MLGKLVTVFLLCLLTACAPFKALASSVSERQIENSVELMNPILQSTWTGVVVDQTQGIYGWNTTVLTIIHDSPETRMAITLQIFPILGRVGTQGPVHSYRVVKWDPCSEVALISTTLEQEVPTSHLAWFKSKPGDRVTTVGNPLGGGLKWNEGSIGALEAERKTCSGRSIRLDSYTGGTVPGQTGSALFNKNGRIAGLLTAVSAFPTPTWGPEGMIGITPIPVLHMGLYIPVDVIRDALKGSLLQ